MGAKDDGVGIPARGELPLNIDGVDRVFVWEIPDILAIEETSGIGISLLLSERMAGVKPITTCLCCALLYDEPTLTPGRVAKWLSKPVFYTGPDTLVGKRKVAKGQQVGMSLLYNIVRMFVNKAIPDDPPDENLTDDEKLKEKLPPVPAAVS